MINCEKERARLETMKKRKIAESKTKRKRERDEPRAPFRLMNHAYAVRACSIINARLIRRSSSTLKIFTKVRTTANLRNKIGRPAETCPCLARRNGRYTIHHSFWLSPNLAHRCAPFPQLCRRVPRWPYDKYRFESRTVIDIFQAVNLFVLLRKKMRSFFVRLLVRCI